jgi:hypothetical protein
MITEILKELFPTLRDATKNGLAALRTTKRKRQQIFVLKAMAQLDPGQLMPPIQYPRYDLHTISNRIRIAQYETALQMHGQGDMILMPSAAEEEQFVRELRKVERRYGLPSVRDPHRNERIEEILHRMVDDNRLRFHPPNMWSIL